VKFVKLKKIYDTFNKIEYHLDKIKQYAIIDTEMKMPNLNSFFYTVSSDSM